MLTAQRMRIGLPVALVAALAIAALALWMALGGSNGGLTDGLQYKGTVEYKVFGADGVLKDHKVFENALNVDPGLDETANRLTGAGSSADLDLFAAAEGDGTASFSRIFASAVARSAGDSDQAYEAGDGRETVGDDVETGGTTIGNNPAQASAANLGAATGGNGISTVAVTFESELAGSAIVELALVKAAVEDLDVGPVTSSAAISDADILATQAVSITLEDEDTLQVTWTVTVTDGG